jgi:hydroxymethylpyrimidine pyrophosphatase-like HAD family hydrolase
MIRAKDIRLLISDVDGTLVTNDKVLTPAAIAAAKGLREAGIALAITSSRPPHANPELVEWLATGAPLAEVDWTTVYASGPRGYSDYPAIRRAAAE